MPNAVQDILNQDLVAGWAPHVLCSARKINGIVVPIISVTGRPSWPWDETEPWMFCAYLGPSYGMALCPRAEDLRLRLHSGAGLRQSKWLSKNNSQPGQDGRKRKVPQTREGQYSEVGEVTGSHSSVQLRRLRS